MVSPLPHDVWVKFPYSPYFIMRFNACGPLSRQQKTTEKACSYTAVELHA